MPEHPKKIRNVVKIVHPWGVEPQSSEPESEILSIELRVQELKCANYGAKVVFFL